MTYSIIDRMQLKQTIIAWMKSNKLSLVLIVLILILLGKNEQFFQLNKSSSVELAYPSQINRMDGNAGAITGMGKSLAQDSFMPPQPIQNDIVPTLGKDRLIIKDTELSLIVKNVSTTLSSVSNYVESIGGFMIDSSMSQPEESGNGRLSVRVPIEKREEALTFIRSQGLRVVNESVYGKDVTDQYEDLQLKIATYQKTKQKFSELFDQSKEISDLLNIQREMISIQSQIDALIGQQQYLEQTSKLSKITIYLSTDELALPYAPSDPWRADVIFKLATRSLIGKVRSLASGVIWIVVYSVLWIPLLIVFFIMRKKLNR